MVQRVDRIKTGRKLEKHNNKNPVKKWSVLWKHWPQKWNDLKTILSLFLNFVWFLVTLNCWSYSQENKEQFKSRNG